MKVQFEKGYDTYEITFITYCEDGDTVVEYKNTSDNAEHWYTFNGYLELKEIIETLQKIVK